MTRCETVKQILFILFFPVAFIVFMFAWILVCTPVLALEQKRYEKEQEKVVKK